MNDFLIKYDIIMKFDFEKGKKLGERHKKRLAKLRYKDKILQLHEQGKTLKEIAQIINYSLVRTNLKTTLSTSTIHRIIQKYKDKK